ncbi:Short-chain dehydrogenase/reductase SDR [Penicillium occitanis (nom. inval.)]|nr:Short-chain dehydrogenase/reductase SDR [Penicillium occitanis (nom. inval.)]PCH01647.1 hypothetical protein PENOC_047040 [Penicillium occitanis (nom. inval.)]
MARPLEANGAKVFILDLDSQKLDEAQDLSNSGNLTPVQCDITSQLSLLAAAEQIERQIGYINLLIANAGIPGPYPPLIPPSATIAEVFDAWWQTHFESFMSTYRVNDAGTFYTILAFIKLLHAGNQQKNVKMSSPSIATANITAFNRQVPGGFAYAMSKAGVVHMMKQMATYLAPYNIRSNAIAPRLFPSAMSNPALEADGESLLATILAGRTGDVKA